MRTTVLFLALAAGACGWVDARDRASGSSAGPTASAGGVIPAPDDSTDWTRPAKDYASTRFSSPIITRDSVRQLGVKATLSTGYVRGHEAAPLVVNNTMYVVTPFPNVLYALDLTKPGMSSIAEPCTRTARSSSTYPGEMEVRS